MISIASLWLPILLSSVAVFAVSTLMHTVLGYHWNDVQRLPQEDAVLDALRSLKVEAGDYGMPRPDSMQQMRSPENVAKFKQGPLVFMTVMGGGFAMGRSMAQWFVYLLLVSTCCAYIASRELVVATPYLAVFRLTGFSAFMAYSLALPQASIWYRRNWRLTLVAMADGLVFAALTGGMFGWLWPR